MSLKITKSRRGTRTESHTFARRVAIALFGLGMVLAILGAELAPRMATAQTTASYHWARKRSSFTLFVGNNLNGDWNGYLRTTMAEWNQGGAVHLAETGGGANAQECQPSSGTVQVCDWSYGTEVGWLGLTRLYLNARGTHIVAATVQMNNSFLYAANSRYNSDAARRHTMCHELGHAIGLDHIDTASCMNDSEDAVFNNLSPLTADFRRLRAIYEHEDAARTVDLTSEAGLSLFAPESAASDPSGLEAAETVIAEPLDGGATVLTFVTWASDESVAEMAVVTASDQEGNPDAGVLEREIEPDAASVDTDGDNVADGDELNRYFTNPMVADTDGDGVLDGEELFANHTDPLLWDDLSAASNPTTPSNGEALLPEEPPQIPTDTMVEVGSDLDGDNYGDALEAEIGLDPGNPDTDGDGVADGDEITIYGTEPLMADSDRDGLLDGEELFGTMTDPRADDTSGSAIVEQEKQLP